jgi:hypothetical protein
MSDQRRSGRVSRYLNGGASVIVGGGGRIVEVARMTITEAGRRVLYNP